MSSMGIVDEAIVIVGAEMGAGWRFREWTCRKACAEGLRRRHVWQRQVFCLSKEPVHAILADRK